MHPSRKTDWRLRLLGISLAGGIAGGALACSSTPAPGAPSADSGADAADDVTVGGDSGSLACNANPDPCCELDNGSVQNPAACALLDAGGDASDAAKDASDAGSD